MVMGEDKMGWWIRWVGVDKGEGVITWDGAVLFCPPPSPIGIRAVQLECSES